MVLEKPEQQRLFFALTPSVELARAFHHLAMTDLQECRGRQLKPEQIHLTLRFIGSVDRPTATCLQQAAGSITLPRFELVFDILGYWPRPKVVWSMPSRTPPTLSALAAQLEQVCVSCGLAAENRAYVPHLTLLRNARQAPASVTMSPLRWPVEAFALIRSETLPQGAVYTELQRWPLQ
ncbi:MAG: RNA 2',3'-cyclic phosphodiesterase [Halobacteria archaeon]|nr:RNA 2',3'-cyclic phosphodiesterase [Halobacteria archaeon]